MKKKKIFIGMVAFLFTVTTLFAASTVENKKIIDDIRSGAATANAITDLYVTGTITVDGSGATGTIGSNIGLTGSETVIGNLHSVTLTCTAMKIICLDAAGVTGHGGTSVYTFVEGLIAPLGVVIDGAITGGGAAFQSPTWVGDLGLGTAEVNTGATPLATTEQNILANTAIAAASAQVATCDAVSAPALYTETGASWIDGTAAAPVMWFNLLYDEHGDNEDNSTNTFTGTIEFSYLDLGDN